MSIMLSMPDVLISEVDPRDGLQSVKSTTPTAHKVAWIDALHLAHTLARGRRDARRRGSLAQHPWLGAGQWPGGLRRGRVQLRCLARRSRRLPLRAGLPGEALHGMTPEAGLPKGWTQETARG